MGDSKIEKQTRKAAFELSNGKVIQGEAFLRLYEAHHTGPQNIGDLLNGDTFFIPVKTGDGVEMLNIREVISVEVQLADEKNDLMTLGQNYKVTLTLANGREQTGEVFVNLPDENTRFKDYINQPERFFPVFRSETILYINRRHILAARD